MKKLCSFLFLFFFFALLPPALAENSGDTCVESSFGTTKIASNGTEIIACMREAVGGTTYKWKSMVSSVASIPVGTIIAWPGSGLPKKEDGVQKWAICNGTTFSKTIYPDLYAVLGSTSLPDYRGMFLRGYGSQPYTDSYGTLTHSSGGLGAVQGDAIRDIKGTWAPRYDLAAVSINTEVTGAFVGKNHTNNRGLGQGSAGYGAKDILVFDASRVVPTANEVRPINIAVRYLIRALP